MIPAETQILDLIEERLRLITTSNDYSLTIERFERASLQIFKGQDLPFIDYWPISHDISNDSFGNELHTLRIIIDCRDKIAEKEDGNFVDQVSIMGSDIVTALNRDLAAPKPSDLESCDLAGQVTLLRAISIAYQIGEGDRPWCGAVVEIEVQYNSDVSDMFNFKP